MFVFLSRLIGKEYHEHDQMYPLKDQLDWDNPIEGISAVDCDEARAF